MTKKTDRPSKMKEVAEWFAAELEQWAVKLDLGDKNPEIISTRYHTPYGFVAVVHHPRSDPDAIIRAMAEPAWN